MRRNELGYRIPVSFNGCATTRELSEELLADRKPVSMPQKIHFRVIQSSSADDQHPASALNQHGLFANGWQSSRSCSYPQELILKFEHHLRLKRVQLLSHQYLIGQSMDTFVVFVMPFRFVVASKIEFLIGSSASERRLELERIHFTRLG